MCLRYYQYSTHKQGCEGNCDDTYLKLLNIHDDQLKDNSSKLMAKFLITTIQVNLVPNTNSPELLLLKILPLAYHHSHFLAANWDFTSFLTMAFLGPDTFFTAGLFWIRLLYGQLLAAEPTYTII